MPGKSNDKIVRAMHEFAATLGPGQVFTQQEVIDWFAARYPKIKPGSVRLYLSSMVANYPQFRSKWPVNLRANRKNSGEWDLFFRIDGDNNRLRLWNEATDGPPQYPEPNESTAPEGQGPDKGEEEEGAPRMAGRHYPKTVRELMHEFAATLEPGQIFTRQDAVDWFAAHYPKISPRTVALHVRAMSTNDIAWRKHRPRIQQGKGFDLFFQVAPDDLERRRLWCEASDPPPLYGPPRPSRSKAKNDDEAAEEEGDAEDDLPEDDEEAAEPVASPCVFRYERDLQLHLARNPELIEPGLRLHQDGLEHSVPGGSIDILAVDASGDLVVIEIKKKKCHKKVVGQLAYYLACMANEPPSGSEGRKIRGVLIGKGITRKTIVAVGALRFPVRMLEYSTSPSFRLSEVKASGGSQGE